MDNFENGDDFEEDEDGCNKDNENKQLICQSCEGTFPSLEEHLEESVLCRKRYPTLWKEILQDKSRGKKKCKNKQRKIAQVIHFFGLFPFKPLTVCLVFCLHICSVV